ncbi:MAG: cytidylate kinase-like family protein [Acidimicrobiia bacterium]|nr:cytidylate kinase-like family protein [Acidimicrobiia bacterium]
MSRVADIDRYLRAYFAADQVQPPPEEESDVRPFLTISRQAGVGGHGLADRIVQEFDAQADDDLFGGWRVYDKTLCQMVADDPRYASSLDSLLDEEYRSKTDDFFHQMVRSTVDQKLVMDKVFLAVRTVAGMGHAVIVGRAGSHVTRDMPQGRSIRIVAPEEMRIEQVMDAERVSAREARSRVRKRDSGRARLLKAHFGADIDDPTGYDVVFNMAHVTPDEIARCAVDLVVSQVRHG